jgi:rhodanese-related sulfurtransferase
MLAKRKTGTARNNNTRPKSASTIGAARMIAGRHFLLMTSIIAFVFSARPLCAAEPLTDTQKRVAVYKMYTDYKRDFPEVLDINPGDARHLLSEGPIQFVDVREPEEIRISTLPGAIDTETYLQNKRQYGNKTLVAFCTIGYRSGIFAQEMARQGVAVKNLKGGILAWVLEGGQIFNENGASKRLHVYGPKWDLAPGDYETIKFGVLKRLTQ